MAIALSPFLFFYKRLASLNVTSGLANIDSSKHVTGFTVQFESSHMLQQMSDIKMVISRKH